MPPNDITYFAETDSRGKHIRFGIKRSDRQYHMALIGRTGMGKSTLLQTLAAGDASDIDLENRRGFAFLDPHGDTAEAVLKLIPPERKLDFVYFNPAGSLPPLGLNLLGYRGIKKHLVVSGVVSVFKKIWSDSWGPRMENLLRFTLASLVEVEGTTIADISRILNDKTYRAWIVQRIDDVIIRRFWNEYEWHADRFRREAADPITNKTGAFLSNPEIRRVVTQQKSGCDFRKIMDEGKIFVANLSKGRLGEDGSALLASLISIQFELAALSRADVPQRDRRDFYLYIDEFPAVAGESFVTMLSESRKYGLALILAMQYVEQLDEPIRNAIFENVGTLISFRVGPESARLLEPQFRPIFRREDLMNLGRFSIYLRLMIDGIPSQPFSARTLPPVLF
jgi:hypothetical protein